MINHLIFMTQSYCLALFLLLFAPIVFAQSTPTEVLDSVAPNQMDEVVVRSLYINDSLLNLPVSIGVLKKSELQANNHTDISTAINRISGIYMQSANLTTNRITIRGIGARTPYGTNKIRAFFGSIPLTSGNSETTIEDLDLENINQIEVIKGPLSSIYGAGLGGAIVISPKALENAATKVQIATIYGSYGLMKNTTSFSTANKSSEFNISYHNLQSDGWRKNSRYNREGITIAGTIFKNKKNTLRYLTNHTYLKAFIPSSIDKETFDNNPRAAAPTWMASQGYKKYKSVLVGMAYDIKISDAVSNTTSIYMNYKDNYEPRPFDILEQFTFGYGGRTQFSGNFSIGNIPTKWHVGLEYFGDDYSSGTFENLYQQNNSDGSLEGNRLSQTHQNRSFYNVFTQWRFLLSKKIELQAGVNGNTTRFDLKTVFPTASISSKNYRYEPIWSPQVSLLYKPNTLQTFYASASSGFSLPSVEETLTANGTINTNIKPESGYHFEIGGKTYLLQRQLYLEVTAYRMLINDLLVARRVGDDQYIGVNAGETLHQGIEVLVNYSWKNRFFSINPYFSASLGKYEFREFIDDENDYSGNKLTGVPAKKWNTGITCSTPFGFSFSADYQFVDEIPLNDANAAFSDAYRLLNFKTGYSMTILSKFTLQLAVGINNVANQHYASMVLVNATAFGTATPRYYYPGLPINYYGNVSFSYAF